MLWFMGKNIFDQQVKNDLRRCNDIWKVTTGQAIDCTAACLLYYNYSKEHCKLFVIDLKRLQTYLVTERNDFNSIWK